jgi:subtilase family serine protease
MRNNQYLTVIIIALLISSALASAIALSAQLEERGLNDTGTAVPDLMVEEITVSSPLYPNETARINATIRNNGTNASQFNVSFWVDCTLREEKTIESLNENSTKELSFNWIPDEAKNYSLTIIADSNKEINESNETNNELEVEVAVLMRITVVIKDSDKNIHIQDLSLKANVSILNATGIACENLNMSFNSSGGNVTRIDGLENPKLFLYNKEKEEWNETGIEHELEDMDIIGWSGGNDLPLMLSDITPKNITILSFGRVVYTNVTNEIGVRIRNKGLLNASNFTSLFTVNNETVDEIKVESLNWTENKSISFNWIPDTTGNYSLTVELDPGNNIQESNETNNNITIHVTVKEIPIIRVPTDYPTVQDAIDAVPPGSTIFIEDGEYLINDNEHTIKIENKNLLWIIGDVDVKLITSSGGFGDLIKIKSSEQITLSGFTVGVEESAKNKKRNIIIEDSNEITLSNLTLYNYATEGVNIEHISLTISNASKCKIDGCKFSTGDDSAYGLIIGSKSRGNIIENNTFNSDTNSIFMGNTTDNILCNNKISRIYVGGEDGYSWPPVYCYSNNNTIYNNKISSISMQGVNNTIYNNIISLLGDKYDPTLPFAGNNNTLYLNNIFGIGKAGICGNNIWNSTTPVSYTYNGTPHTNYTGNFWADYRGVDDNCDGIGDVPYEVCTDNYDYCPLIGPYGLTFDLAVTAIARPYITYADRENTILVTIGRTGTYPSPEDVNVSFMANDAEVDSKIVSVGLGEKVVNFTWMPPDVGDYKLSVEVHPGDELLSEMDDTNNEFSIDVVVLPSLFDCDYTAEISSALDFLNGEQLATGNIWGFENSGWAALGIAAAGRDFGSLIDYLRKEPGKLKMFLPPGENPPDLIMPEDFARMVLVISAVGEDPTNFGGVNYLTMLKSYYDGEQVGERDDVKDDAFAILALVSCGDKDQRTKNMIANASEYIKDKQNGDGGWGQFGGDSDVKTTALVIQALVVAGEDDNQEVVENALEYLRNARDENGGYSNVKATSYAIQAFITAGEDISNYSGTIDYLLSLQQEDGSFNYTTNMSFFPPMATTYPLPALCGEPYPVMLKTIRGNYELSDISVDNVMVEEDEICVNTSYTVKTNIKSNGGIFYVDLLSDGELTVREKICPVWCDSLTPRSFSWRTNTTGYHNLTIFADSMNNISESEEANNNKTKKVEVVYPDLYPSDIMPPDNVYVNVTNVIDCTIKGTTDERFNVTLEADGEPVGEQKVEGLRENTMITFEWRPLANRTYNLTLTADADNEVHERENDTSNVLIVPVNGTLPDMTPADIWADERVYVNARNRINVTVRGMAESFNVSLIENGTVVGKTANVTCYGKENITIYWKPMSLGNHTITAFVDSDADIKETNEGNNNITETFEVLLPDLVPEAITPQVLYIDEVNTISVKVNGTAEAFNATLMAKQGIDKSGPFLYYVITPLFNGTPSINKTFIGSKSRSNRDSNITYEITAQQSVWSWEDIDTLNVIIESTTSTGLADSGDTWAVDYVAVIANYTETPPEIIEYAPESPVNDTAGAERTFSITIDQMANVTWLINGSMVLFEQNVIASSYTNTSASDGIWNVTVVVENPFGSTTRTWIWNVNVNVTVPDGVQSSTGERGSAVSVQTLELNASGVISPGNWSNANNTYISNDEYATATEITRTQLSLPDTGLTYGKITSVVIKVEQHAVNHITPLSKNDTLINKKTNLNTYNDSIEFEWLTTEFSDYELMVFLDSDDDINETEEENNNLTEVVYVRPRIDLKLTSPLGGEIWKGIQNVTWNASYEEPLLIDFYYSPDRGYRWINIAINEMNNGSYAWDTEDVIDGEYMIKIVVHAGMVTAEDRSDVFFVRNTKAGMESGQFPHPYSPCDGPDTDEIAWMSEDIGASSSSSLIVAKGKVFVYATGEHGDRISGGYTYLVALDQSNGEVVWATDIYRGEYFSWATPVYNSGSVFMSCGKGITRLDADDGHKEWTFDFPSGEGAVDGGPAVTDRAIYAGDWLGHHYYCIENNRTKPREVIWTFPSEGRAQSTPAIAYGNVYFGSFCYGECLSKAFCVDAIEGTKIWSTLTGDVCGSVTVADGRIYFTTYTDPSGRHFYALDAFNGTVLWAKKIAWSDSTPAYKPPSRSSRSYIYVATDWGELHCFNAKTGKEIWKTSGVACWTTSPVVTKDGKVFAGNALKLYCLDALTGDTIWESYGGPSPAVANGFVYTVYQGRVIAYGNGTMPDLTVKASAPDGEYVVEKEGNIVAIIENIGNANVTKSFRVELRYSGEFEEPPIDQITVDPLFNVNEPKTIPFKWVPDPERERYKKHTHTREYDLTVVVDPPDPFTKRSNVTESGWEDNNFANVTVTVQDNKPDLVTTIENVSPNPAYVGRTVKVEANITNIGNETNETFNVMFFVKGDWQDAQAVDGLQKNQSKTVNFAWLASTPGNYTLMNKAMNRNDANYWDNINETTVKVIPSPTPTPTPIPPKNIGHGPGKDGIGEGPGGIGKGSGTGEAGAGEAGGMQIPVNASGSAAEKKKEVFGFPFGNASSGASGGGGTLPVLLVLLAILVITLFYFGYYKEKRSHAKQVLPGAYRRNRNRK